MMSTPKKQRTKACLKPLTKRQLEVLEACHYGEVFLEYKHPVTRYGVIWSKWVLNGADCTSVVRLLAKTGRLRLIRDHSVTIEMPRWRYTYIVLVQRGLEELESHPTPWKE